MQSVAASGSFISEFHSQSQGVAPGCKSRMVSVTDQRGRIANERAQKNSPTFNPIFKRDTPARVLYGNVSANNLVVPLVKS